MAATTLVAAILLPCIGHRLFAEPRFLQEPRAVSATRLVSGGWPENGT